MTHPRLIAIGGAHVDRRGRCAAAFIPGASNPGAMAEDIGGGAFNAVRVARSRGVAAAMLSVRGGDLAGESATQAIMAAGIDDCSATFLDRRTASYTAILDQTGDVVAALADMSIYETAFARALRRKAAKDAVRAASAILVDANPAPDALEAIFAMARAPVHAIAISPAKVVRFRPHLARLATLFMNRREAATLAGPADGDAALADRLRGLGLTRGVVTDGPAPVLAFDADGAFLMRPPAAGHVADVTGAGDALAGATIAALMAGGQFRQAVADGMAASQIALATPEAGSLFTEAMFEAARRRIPGPDPI